MQELTRSDSGFRATVYRVFLLVMVLAAQATAAPATPDYALERFVAELGPQEAFPGADELGAVDGDPPVVEAFAGGDSIGYVFLNSDFVNSTGYSGKPIHQLIAIDLDGVIRQVLLVEHHEPIVLIGISETRIRSVLENYAGLDVGALVRKTDGSHQVDVVTGATVTVMVMDDTILRSAIKVARRYGLGGLRPEREQTGPRAAINMEFTERRDWKTLLSEGSVADLKTDPRRYQRGVRRFGQRDRGVPARGGRPRRGVHRAVWRGGLGAGHRPERARRVRIRQPRQAAGARSARPRAGRRRPLFL